MAKFYGTDELSHIEQLAEIESVPANYLVQILSELRNKGEDLGPNILKPGTPTP